MIERGIYYEEQFIRRFLGLLLINPRLQLVDIGANIGLWSLPAARLTKVVSVEPDWRSMARLAVAVDLGHVSSNITLIHNAIHNVHTTLRMGASSINPSHAFLIETSKCKATLSGKKWCDTLPPIDTIILNDILPLVQFKSALMKVDVEGNEVNVFTESTAGKLFDHIDIPIVFMEWALCKQRPTVQRLLDFFYNRNFSAFDLRNSKLRKHYSKWPPNIVFKKSPYIDIAI